MEEHRNSAGHTKETVPPSIVCCVETMDSPLSPPTSATRKRMRIPNVVCQLTNAELTEEEIPEFLAHPEQVHPGDEIFAVVETDNGKFLDEEIEIDPKEEPPRLTHRLHGKQTWPPVLCAMRTGAEWLPGEKTDEEYLAECKAQWENVNDIYNAAAMELLQLEELRKVEREEKAMMASSDDAKLVLRIGSEGAERCGRELPTGAEGVSGDAGDKTSDTGRSTR